MVFFFYEKSIFEHILAYTNPSGPGLLPGGEILPDESEYSDTPGVHWAPGSLDILTNHPAALSEEEKKKKVDKYIEMFREVTGDPTEDKIKKLEELLASPDTLSIIDNVLRRLISDTKVNQSILYRVCRYLFFRTGHRGVLKFCVAIMGLYGVKEDTELFESISRHEEFTLYAIIAVMNNTIDTVDAWLRMAKNVTGWGRIHLVSRLSDYDRPDVKKFLLTEGCKNDIMEEYTACTIATAVDLHKILAAKKIDRNKYAGAGIVLSALVNATIRPGPFEEIDNYESAEKAVEEYIRHSGKMAVDLDDFIHLDTIRKVTLNIDDGGCLEKLEWKEATLKYISDATNEILERPCWKNKACKSLESDDYQKRWNAVTVANIIGLQIEKKIMNILEDNPLRPHLWYVLMQRANENNIDDILSLAGKKLKFKKIDKIKTADELNRDDKNKKTIIIPWNEMESATCNCLERILRELHRPAKMGWNVIKNALECPSSRTKLVAIGVLKAWNANVLDDDVKSQLEGLLDDPDDMVRIGAENILRMVLK
ncbi:MAG: hypothetical protein K8T10_00590 [Candidatus Eremiobacteraeota bacterium]|nr:hypothetical protein [Candidatus Eremiobacteraeota bacterium]